MTGMSKKRLHDLFHVLKVIRHIVDLAQEATDAAIEHAARDRTFLNVLRPDLLSEEATQVTDLESFVRTIAESITQLQSICHLLISERETLGKALESIRGALESVDIAPRTRNAGKQARRRADAGTEGSK
jgi:hypothetical protein